LIKVIIVNNIGTQLRFHSMQQLILSMNYSLDATFDRDQQIFYADMLIPSIMPAYYACYSSLYTAKYTIHIASLLLKKKESSNQITISFRSWRSA
jgi:hypothetical protein